MTRTQRTAIDLFCGAGGLSEGFRQAGYSVLAGHDINEVAGLTYAATHPGSKFLLGSISDLSIRDLCGVTGVKPGDLDVLLGGPPCQAYSVYNHQRGMHDARSGLFWEYLRIVKGLMPKWVVIENVTGITSIDGGEVVRTIKRELGALGYEVDLRILRAEDYGIPQERRRVVFIGNRVGAPVRFPVVTHGAPDNGLIPLTTIWDAIGDLPQIGNGGAGDRTYRHHPMSDFQRYARQDAGRFAKNHEPPRLSAVNIARMKHIPIGGSWRDIPYDLLPEGMKRAKRSDHTKRYGRMDPAGQSCTVLTKCDVHWGAYIHPYEDRAITVREAARLQGFQDTFEFKGSRTEQYIQVGNAVPPLLGRCIAQAVLEAQPSIAVPARRAGRRIPLAA